MLTDRFDDALAFAARLHREQTRKGTAIPYVSHLLAVCGLVLENGGDEDAAIGALLHDAVEDQGGRATLDIIRTRYGEAVAAIVADCTDAWIEPKPPWRERKAAYLSALPGKADASLLVSLADKTHNVRAIAGDYHVLGEALWPRFTGRREGTLWYYRSLANAFRAARPCRLTEAFAAEVDALTRAAGGA